MSFTLKSHENVVEFCSIGFTLVFLLFHFSFLSSLSCDVYRFLLQVFPSVTGEDEDDVKSIRSHRIKMETSGNSLEESMEEGRVEELSVSKVGFGFRIHRLTKLSNLNRLVIANNDVMWMLKT